MLVVFQEFAALDEQVKDIQASLEKIDKKGLGEEKGEGEGEEGQDVGKDEGRGSESESDSEEDEEVEGETRWLQP